MKKVIAIIVSALFVLSVAGLSFAADAPAPAPAKKEAAPAKIKQVTGEVVAVDATAKTLTIKGKKGDVALSVGEKAAAKLADIKVGDKATVKYKEIDGKNVASSITAKKAAAKKAEKAEKKAAAGAPAPKAEEKK